MSWTESMNLTINQSINQSKVNQVINWTLNRIPLQSFRFCACYFYFVTYCCCFFRHPFICLFVLDWLFPLAFGQTDQATKYFACLCVGSLIANKELEAAVVKSGTLDLVNEFVTDNNPEIFATVYAEQLDPQQSRDVMTRLIPSLESHIVEAQQLAAFHFATEAHARKKKNDLKVCQKRLTVRKYPLPLSNRLNGMNGMNQMEWIIWNFKKIRFFFDFFRFFFESKWKFQVSKKIDFFPKELKESFFVGKNNNLMFWKLKMILGSRRRIRFSFENEHDEKWNVAFKYAKKLVFIFRKNDFFFQFLQTDKVYSFFLECRSSKKSGP